MKKLFILITCCISVLAFAAQPINRVVAIVNNNVITEVQLQNQIQFVKANLQANHTTLPSAQALRMQVINQMINQQLQLQIAKRNNIRVSDAEVNRAIRSVASRNGKTTAAFYASVQSMGLNRQAFRQKIRNELIMNKLQRSAVAGKIAITPQEVNSFLMSNAGQKFNTTEYHLADILVALPNAPTAAQIQVAKQKAQHVLAQAKNSSSFQTLAIAHSNGQNALQGGDLGWRKLLQIPTIFANHVVNMKINQVAGPFHNANGFYIIKLLGTRSGDKGKALSPAQLKEQVENLIFQRKLQQRLQSWILQLRSSAYIKIMDQ